VIAYLCECVSIVCVGWGAGGTGGGVMTGSTWRDPAAAAAVGQLWKALLLHVVGVALPEDLVQVSFSCKGFKVRVDELCGEWCGPAMVCACVSTLRVHWCVCVCVCVCGGGRGGLCGEWGEGRCR
jgi:hypothetical protein